MAASRTLATISRCAPGGRFGRLAPPGRLGGRLGGARNCAPGCAVAGGMAAKSPKIRVLRRIMIALNSFSDLANEIIECTQKDS